MFTPAEINEIINLFTSGIFLKDISKKYNCSQSTIGRLLRKHNIITRNIISVDLSNIPYVPYANF